MVKLMKRYQTSIKSLIQAKVKYQSDNGVEPIFLSHWDSDHDSVMIPNLKFDIVNLLDMQKYYFWTDEENFKEYVQKFFLQQFAAELSSDKFTIGSNGTSSLMLALASLKELKKNIYLLLLLFIFRYLIY